MRPIFITLVCFALFGSIGGSPAKAARQQALQTGTFDHITFVQTTGRVGYHMFASVFLLDSDTPTGSVDTCGVGTQATTVRGVLPPGLTLLANDNNGGGLHGFDGTPRQPGDWTVHVVIAHIGCLQGSDRADHGPKTVQVQFHITP